MTDANLSLRILDNAYILCAKSPTGDQISISMKPEIYADHSSLQRCVDVLNEKIASWPIGPYTIADVRAAAYD